MTLNQASVISVPCVAMVTYCIYRSKNRMRDGLIFCGSVFAGCVIGKGARMMYENIVQQATTDATNNVFCYIDRGIRF